MKKFTHNRLALVALVVVAVFAIGSTGATAAHLIGSKGIKDNSIKSRDIKDGTIKTRDLNAATITELKGAQLAPAQAPPAQAPVGAQLAADSTSDLTVITDIGGTFGKFTETVRATKLDEVTLPAGTYQLSADGMFRSIAATSGLTRLQLAVRVDDGTDWGQDLGTCFTGVTSPLNDREATCSSTRVVTLAETSVVQVFAFGYADDQGSADSGKFEAQSFLSAVEVG